MILKNILGKTIDAAKKTAQQMYGDDFLVVDTSEATSDKQAKITIFSDKEPKPIDRPASDNEPIKQSNVKQDDSPGVLFERSESSAQPQKIDNKNDKLNSLRKFAEQLDKQEQSQHQHSEELRKNALQNNNLHEESEPVLEEDNNKSESSGTVYSRSAVRPKVDHDTGSENYLTKAGSKRIFSYDKFVELSDEEEQDVTSNLGTLYSSDDHYSAIELPKRSNEREIKALHKRFDKLEALIDSSLISANLDYASHPAFQQLVKTGINTSIIAGWFSQIIGEGIDPFTQPEQFMAKLAGILRSALGKEDFDDPQKFLLFVGPSGAGKTSLIMKLSKHSDLMVNKKIAVISVHPQKENKETYYTILKPFCEDNSIPYYELKSSEKMNEFLAEWNEFDHVLIDTPSINIEQNSSFRDFWKIRQMLTPLAPMEVHYVVNASLNRFYFRNSSAIHHPLQPNYVAITHLDEISQWGPIIPFLEEMGCNARFISKGDDLSGSVDEFNPHWFAQKILQEN